MVPWGGGANFFPSVFQHLAADIPQKVDELRKASWESYGRIRGELRKAFGEPCWRQLGLGEMRLLQGLVVEPAGMEEHGRRRILTLVSVGASSPRWFHGRPIL